MRKKPSSFTKSTQALRNFLPVHALRSWKYTYGLWTLILRTSRMKSALIAKISAAILLAAALGACGNTIRGIGHDGANAVNATQDAGRSVNRAAKY
jgi:predicted small secreted protein